MPDQLHQPLPPIAVGGTLILQEAIIVDRSAADVWAFVRDMENYPLWFEGIVKMASADDMPIATIGKCYDETAIVPGGKEETIDVKIVAADEAAHHLAIQASLAPFVPRFDYRVVPLDESRCTFHWRCVATGQSFKAKWQRPVFRMILRKRLATSFDNFRRILAGGDDEVMRAALFWRFGAADDVIRLFDRAARPKPKKGEVLVRQMASSINPIDYHRRQGYGRNVMRLRGALKFPIILGNDIAGQIVAAGEGVSGFAPGDAVVGVKAPSSQGSFADYVTVKADTLIAKPAELDFEQAAALPYTFFTAWSALSKEGGLSRDTAKGKRIFIQGGAGGVGSMAVQIAKYLGADVIASCGAGSKALVQSLGAGTVFDYASEDYAEAVKDVDIALCTANADEEAKMLSILKRGGRYVTVIHPTLAMTDELGVLKGFIASKKLLKAKNKALAAEGKSIGWGLFRADPDAVTLFREMVAGGHLKPVIDQVYPFDQIAAAMERVESGKAKGKLVVNWKAE
jgi:reticulon-4-interacting protein 1, mitochondrial